MYAYWITVNYREAYGMFASNGILFNHESPIRGETFVTRKITRAVSRIALGIQDKLYLGNLDSKRDWGHAKDYVRMMWMILQAEESEDWVIATGRTTSIRDFVKMAFNHIGVELEFLGEGINEVAKIASCSNPEYQLEIGKEVLSIDEKYFRPTEVDLLIGDPTKAKQKLGWEPEITLEELVEDMMSSDLRLFKKDKYLKDGGFNTLTIMNSTITLNSKIYIAGHNGMVGSACWRALKAKGYKNIIGFSSKELDLRDQRAVFNMLEIEKPEAIIDAAAKVGGILANSNYPYEFLMDNMLIQNNLIKAAHELDITKFIFLGSSCIYPKMAPQPLKEEYLLTAHLKKQISGMPLQRSLE